MKQPPERLVNRGLSISSCCLLHQSSVIIQQWRKTTKAGYNNVCVSVANFTRLALHEVMNATRFNKYIPLLKKCVSTMHETIFIFGDEYEFCVDI